MRRSTYALGALVFGAGIGALATEITASRLLAPYFGSSTIVWANLIGIVLAALALGYWLGGRIADRRPEPSLLGSVVLLSAVFVAVIPFVAEPFLGLTVEGVIRFFQGAVFVECLTGLDRLPLAVELAAARTSLLPPQELLTRLRRRLPILTHGRRDAPERQRTLRATIEWSYDLLDSDAQAAFRRLSVFRGSFTLDAAEEVTLHNDRLDLLVCFNYGGRAELEDAAKQGGIADNLYAPDVPDVDLLIRTSGEKRLSNFLLWQAAYAELYFTDLLWPDFDRHALFDALRDYADRTRRFGALP
jgi:hypothetical protein